MAEELHGESFKNIIRKSSKDKRNQIEGDAILKARFLKLGD